MRGEDFVGDVGDGVEEYGNPHVAPGFRVNPVHDEDEHEDADEEVHAVLPAFGDEVRLVVALDGGEWQMPRAPEQRKDDGGGKEVEAAQQGVGAVGVPGEFFDQRGKEEQEPRRKERAAEAGRAANHELVGAVAEGERDGHRHDDGKWREDEGEGDNGRVEPAPGEKPRFQVGEQQRVGGEKPGGDGNRCEQAGHAERALQPGVVGSLRQLAEVAGEKPAKPRDGD